MRRLIPLLLSSIMISALAVTLFAPLVSAASVYDDVIETTSTLKLGSSSSPTDITTDFVATMLEACGETVTDAYTDAVADEDGGWFITNTLNGDGYYTIEVYWNYDKDGGDRTANFFSSGSVRALRSNVDGIAYFKYQYGTSNPTCDYSNTSGNITNTWLTSKASGFPTPQVFIANWLITYPEDYDGQIPPDQQDPPVDIYPRMYYSVTDKKIHSNPMQALSSVIRDYIPVSNATGYISYLLTKCTDDSYDDCETVATYLPNQIETSSFDYTVSEYGYYILSAQYTWPTPVPEPQPENVQFAYPVALFQLDVNGETYDGSYLDQDCDANFCPATSSYKDCSDLFGDLDLIGGFGCVMENFGVFIRTTLRTLFGPQNIADFSKSLVEFNTNTYGLTSIVTAPISFLEEIRQGTYTCSPLAVPLPFTGMSYTLPCMTSFWEGLGSFYTLYQTVVNGFVSYYVIVGMLGLVKGFKDPQNDKIEVLKL